MHRHWRKLAVLPGLLLALLVASCEQSLAPTPDAVSGPVVATVVEDADGHDYTLIEEWLPTDLATLRLSKLIGIEGGSIHLAGHTLTVPAFAVRQPTVFLVTLASLGGYVEVDLTAVTLLGLRVTQFNRPLTLSLTYARGANLPEDRQKLLIVHVPGLVGYGTVEPLESEVDETGNVVRAKLYHFSRYCLAAG